MARKSQRRLIAELLEQYEPTIQQAFMEAVAELRNGTTLRVVAERLERNDVVGAVQALNVEPEAFSRVETAILEAYNAGGQATVDNMPTLRDPDGQVIPFRWGVRNLPAEQELRLHAANLVTETVEDQREGLRQVLTEGLARGQNPRETARDIVGRRSRANNRRVGGYLGLTSRQMQTTAWIRRALAQGDVEAMRRYLGLKTRDKRFDRSVARAIRQEAGLDAELVDRIAGRYASRALDYRGRQVSRHETMIALSKSRHDAFEQQIASGKVEVRDITKTWKHTPRENPRMQHVQMNGQVVPFDQPFTAPDGTQIRYPHDPQAPAYHTIGCMCWTETSIDFTSAALRRYRARVDA